VTLDRDKSGVIDASGVNVTTQFFRIKSPTALSKTFIRVDKKEPVVFEWDALPPNFDVYLEIGKTREKLDRMFPKVPGQSGFISSQIKIGTYFWRLTAVDIKNPLKVYS